MNNLTQEILTTDMIRMVNGNATYIVRHLTPIKMVRELEISVRNGALPPDQLFHQIKKKQLAMEASGHGLGSRIQGVCPAGPHAVYRCTFLLEQRNTFWPWSHGYKHPHGTTPFMCNFLQNDAWKASKPYTCKLCYNSNHHAKECPLTKMRISGISIVSVSSYDCVYKRHPQEKETLIDRSHIPLIPQHPPGSGGGGGGPDAPPPPGGSGGSGAPPAPRGPSLTPSAPLVPQAPPPPPTSGSDIRKTSQGD